MIDVGWGADWPNASTVIPELLAANGGWNLSRWKDEAFTAESDAAKDDHSTAPSRARPGPR